MARVGPRAIGRPRIKKRFGQSVAQVEKNIRRRTRITGFSFSKGKKDGYTYPKSRIGFGFK